MGKKQDRRIRLFGKDQTNDRYGGGMPIPSMVSQMLDHLQDSGPTPIADLVEMVERRHHKRERLEYVYHKGHKLEGDAYALFIDDVIAELESAKLAARQGDRLTLGPAFKLGERLRLPEGMSTIVYEKSAREIIGRASLHELDIKALANELRPEGRGLRPLNPDNVERLVKSMEAFGFMDGHPVLKDQEGRILSGRHRIEAAGKVGIPYQDQVIRVASDREALAIAFTANLSGEFSKAERRHIAKLLSAAGIDIEDFAEVIGEPAKHVLIQAELLKNASQSDNKIAKQVGTSNNTVADVRAKLETTLQIAKLSHRTGADGRNRASKHNGNSQLAKVLAAIKANSEITSPELARMFAKADPPIDRGSVGARLRDLVKSGEIVADGSSKLKRYSVSNGKSKPVKDVSKSAALARLRKAWAKCDEQERAAFLREVS